MMGFRNSTVLALGLAVGLSFASPVSSAEDAAIRRQSREILGWQVHIDRRLTADTADTERLSRAIELLTSQLAKIEQDLPPKAVAKLRQVPLYFSPEYPQVSPKAEYHPGAGWLRDHGRDPVMVEAVEFTNVRIFEEECSRMPSFVLHELAHAYHHRFLPGGFENPQIRAAYERARDSGLYARVERWLGNGKPNRFEQAYAMTSPMEYFAETTEAYFGRNDFYPFDSAELQRHDPDAYELLGELWGVTE
ncbi:MAG: hypothetical protein EA381_13700 [Planctomycetaceae bacterium]|nr:MAG: hypothetical protein EA381_13700 [Planctomycetaceae bacterium]